MCSKPILIIRNYFLRRKISIEAKPTPAMAKVVGSGTAVT